MKTLEALTAAIAPEVTKYVLDTLRLYGQKAFALGSDEERDLAANQIADLSLSIATELRDRLAHAETLDAQTQETLKAELAPPIRKQSAKNPITDLLSQPSGVSSEALKLRAMREKKYGSPSQEGPDRPEAA
jgi:hypothetical protein